MLLAGLAVLAGWVWPGWLMSGWAGVGWPGRTVRLDGRPFPEPDLGGGRCVDGTYRAQLTRLDPATGAAAWQVEVPPRHGIRQPLAVAGGVVLGAGRENLVAVDLRTGKPLWQWDSGWVSHTMSRDRASGDRVGGDGAFVVWSAGGAPWSEPAVAVRDSRTGATVWSAELGADGPAPVGAGDPDAGLVYAGAGDSIVALGAADGASAWRQSLPPPIVPPLRGLAVVGGVVVAAGTGGVVALDARTGATRWSRPAAAGEDGHAVLGGGEGVVVVGAESTVPGRHPGVVGVAAQTGQPLWRRADLDAGEALDSCASGANRCSPTRGPGRSSWWTLGPAERRGRGARTTPSGGRSRRSPAAATCSSSVARGAVAPRPGRHSPVGWSA